ncbi:hypothetical protein GSY74_10250, partial [Sulfurovum sp. bin170]|uniref:condensation domain-containing protein n=1 Tax=Sulfurovum sp. bin170 TaxID=2695268 RepID=UPI001417CD7F
GSVVIVKDEQLIAYIVGDSNGVKEHLKEKLPSYMIPSFFIEIETIPLTSNGKVDKKSLPEVDMSLDMGYVAPKNLLQESVATIFEEVLRLDSVGIDDNFFEIGGDSIKAIQISSKLLELGYQLKIKELFQHQTIAQLVPLLKESKNSIAQDDIVGDVLLSPIQQSFFEDFEEYHHYNHSVILTANLTLDKDSLEKALLDIYNHHDMLRASFEIDNENKIKQYINTTATQIILDEIVLEEEISIGKDILDNLHKNIDLVKPYKFTLFKLQDCYKLSIIIHHLLVDGVSWRVLLEDLKQSYLGKPLPLKTHSFQEYVEVIDNYASSEELLLEADYWNEILSKIEDNNSIKKVKNRELKQAFIEFSQDEYELIKSANRAYKTEINHILLSALSIALDDFEDKVIFLEGHGREDVLNLNLDRTIGWFTTMFPVDLGLLETREISSIVREIKERINSIPNKGVGYGVLKYFSEKIEIEKTPVISFNYLGEMDNQRDSIFELKDEYSGAEVSEEEYSKIDIDINGSFSNHKLSFRVDYNSHHYSEDRIISMLNIFRIT